MKDERSLMYLSITSIVAIVAIVSLVWFSGSSADSSGLQVGDDLVGQGGGVLTSGRTGGETTTQPFSGTVASETSAREPTSKSRATEDTATSADSNVRAERFDEDNLPSFDCEEWAIECSCNARLSADVHCSLSLDEIVNELGAEQVESTLLSASVNAGEATVFYDMLDITSNLAAREDLGEHYVGGVSFDVGLLHFGDSWTLRGCEDQPRTDEEITAACVASEEQNPRPDCHISREEFDTYAAVVSSLREMCADAGGSLTVNGPTKSGGVGGTSR